ncbi:MAG: FtsW/RodA/SpoVE family cell cycle protein [Firmicutes bacterium]|nr:FtsW/RodA/SpoVE family cell cycle protein [Bacillota bacterium]
MLESLDKSGQGIMEALATLFDSYPALATYYTTAARWIFVGLAVFILGKTALSLLARRNPSEIWAYLRLPDGSVRPLTHWENVIGRARSSDIVIDVMTVSRNHGTLSRDQYGNWRYNDLGSKGGSLINGRSVYQSTPVEMGDTITLGGADCILVPPSLKEKQENIKQRLRSTRGVLPWSPIIAITIFQIMTVMQLFASKGSKLPFTVLLSFLLLTIVMWAYCIFLRIMSNRAFEMEAIAFFLCTLSLAVVSTSEPESTFKQFIAIVIGIVIYTVMMFFIRNLERGVKIRNLLMIISVALLLFNVVFGEERNGATAWVSIGGYNMQPSELVKIAFIFIGSATLDELYEKRNLTVFMIFSIFCLGCLALMNDFGTALIFFVTFLIISFLRSGEFTKLILVLGVCAVGGLMAIRFVGHIANRFATWGHVWDYPDAGGFQQVRAMSAGASGGLAGVGAGNGWFKSIFASNADLVFCYLQEEWGLIIAVLAVLAIIILGLYAVRSIKSGRSTFYTIAACSATSLLIFQSTLNVLGTVDVLPFTGVTLPFVSNGGTSMMSSWGLLAFLKAADTRQGASIAVKDDSEDNDELFIEDYIAMADEEASEQRLAQAQRARSSQGQPQTRSTRPAPKQRQPEPGRPRNPNLRQGDVEITDFSQLEDDDL